MLIIAKNLEELDFPALMEVYTESNEENGLEFWPDKTPEERMELAKGAFYDYLRDGFFGRSHGTYYIYEKDGGFLSALRLESFRDGLLLEALETRPDARRMGHAGKLIEAVLEQLPAGTKVYSHVSKTNIASIATHRACGFPAAHDYGLGVDGEHCEYELTFLFEK